MSRRGDGFSVRTLLGAAVMIAALGASPAMAAATTRYAAPGGTATDDVCVTPTAPPCSIGTATAGANVVLADEAVIRSGNYTDIDLDGADDSNPTDGTIQAKAGSVHGELGKPRPVITFAPAGLSFGAFMVQSGVTLSHLEIVSATASNNLSVNDTMATLDGVVSRNSASNGTACNHMLGTIRNTACLATGSGGIGVGSDLSTFASTLTLTLRGVTAVSTGGGGFGLRYRFFGAGVIRTVDVRNTIARGTGTDIAAAGRSTTPATPGTGAQVTVTADFSNYATEQETADAAAGGSATITNPGAANNELAAPALAADGFHQLPSSASTINQGGPLDAASGTLDIDRQARQIGLAASDIGADELAIASTTTLGCAPPSLTLGGSTACTATVAVPAEFINGTVEFSSVPTGGFGPAASCNVSGPAPSAQCTVTFTPSQALTHQLTAAYLGGTNHDPSQDDASVTVTNPPASVPNPPSSVTPGATEVDCATLRQKLKRAKKKLKAARKADKPTKKKRKKVKKLRRELAANSC